MRKNVILEFSYTFLLLFEFILVVSTIIIIFFISINLLNPEAWSRLITLDEFEPGFWGRTLIVGEPRKADSVVYLPNLSAGMKIWLLFRNIIMLVFMVLIVRSLKKLIKSVQSNVTFYEGNVQNFRKMSIYGIIIAIFSCFNFLIYPDLTTFNFSIPFFPIGFVLSCLLLAEVFKEGRELLEDKKAIV